MQVRKTETYGFTERQRDAIPDTSEYVDAQDVYPRFESLKL